MFGVIPLSGAYGRRYTSRAKAQVDLDAGKDFRTPMGQYINREDLIKRCGMKPGTKIEVRLGKNDERSAILTIKEG